MYNITIESYFYKCGWCGIKPELSYIFHTLDPKSVTIETEDNKHTDHRIQISNQSIIIKGCLQSWKGYDPLRKVGDKVRIYINRYIEPPPGLYREEMDNLRIGRTRFAHGINTVLYPCKTTLYINWKEYPFEYMKEHLMEMKALFDQAKTDALLEEIDG